MVTDNKIVNPNENLLIPPWVTAEYFETILKKDETDYVKVLKFTPVAAIPPGENFTSIMIRIFMELEMQDGSVKQKNYVLKTMLDDDKGGKMVNELSLFPKELEMYQKYLPAFEALYKEAGYDIQISPKCLFTEKVGERINLVFEDLQLKKFQNIDRINGCDMNHMRAVLKKLAEFHAASVIAAPYSKQFQHGFINKDQIEVAKKMFSTKVENYKEAMLSWGLEDIEKYIEKFPIFEQYWKCGLSTMNTDSNSFNVLTHGDFWSSNLMANYLADGTLDQILLLDFQVCKWGSPAEDLLFFISISAAKDIRIKEFDHFVEIYHEHLIKCLTLLKYKKPLPKLRDLQKDMYSQNTSFYAFFSLFNHLPVVLFPTDKESNMHSLTRDDEIGKKFRMRLFTNPLFVETIKDLYPFYYRRGLLNFEDYD